MIDRSALEVWHPDSGGPENLSTGGLRPQAVRYAVIHRHPELHHLSESELIGSSFPFKLWELVGIRSSWSLAREDDDTGSRSGLNRLGDNHLAGRDTVPGLYTESPVRAFLINYIQRHQHPVNQLLHVVGVPLTFIVSLIWLIQGAGWLALGAFLGGYLLQFIGHAIEGNDAGETIIVKRALGLPYIEIVPRPGRERQ